MQYDQNIVLLISRSNASPEAACVIFQGKRVSLKIKGTSTRQGRRHTCASVKAGGLETNNTFATTNTGLRARVSSTIARIR
jgi:hypothetical protein